MKCLTVIEKLWVILRLHNFLIFARIEIRIWPSLTIGSVLRWTVPDVSVMISVKAGHEAAKGWYQTQL
jgi:hypothetical protein